MDVNEVFANAESKLAWETARSELFNAFDQMYKNTPMPLILPTAQDAMAHSCGGRRSDATVEHFFREWKDIRKYN
jgi:hypothetical protein